MRSKRLLRTLPTMLICTLSLSTMHALSATPELKNFNEASAPITTSYPASMIIDTASSCEGQAFVFKFTDQANKDDGAEVRIFLPGGVKNTAEADRLERSIIKSSGWKIVQGAANLKSFPYPWVKKTYAFEGDSPAKSAANTNHVQGRALIGEAHHQGVCVTIRYPKGSESVTTTAAKTVLRNLKFKPNQLPIPPGD